MLNAKPENRINLSLFGLFLNDDFRVWFLERDANIATNDVRFIEADFSATPAPALNLRDNTISPPCITFKMQNDWMTKFDPFKQQHFLPPAIMVQLHVIDDKASTYRIAQKVFNIAVAPTVLPKKPGNW